MYEQLVNEDCAKQLLLNISHLWDKIIATLEHLKNSLKNCLILGI